VAVEVGVADITVEVLPEVEAAEGLER
jgi:hypothetical protein